MNPLSVAGLAVLLAAAVVMSAHADCPAKTADIKITTDMQAGFDALNQAQGHLAAQQVALEQRIAALDAKEAAVGTRLVALPGAMKMELRDNHGSPAQCLPGELLVGGQCWLEDGSSVLQNAGITEDPRFSNAIPPSVFNCTWTLPAGHVVPHMVAACLAKSP